MEAEAASFNTVIDSTEFKSMRFMSPSTPSININGEVAEFSEPNPLILIEALSAPG